MATAMKAKDAKNVYKQMLENADNEYWFCFIGPVKKKKLGWGADGPLRLAVKDKFNEIFGIKKKTVVASGWGMNQKKYDLMRVLSSMTAEELEKILRNNGEMEKLKRNNGKSK
jgi:hypothetical protein